MSFSSKVKVVALMAAVLAIFASVSSTSEAGWGHRACCAPVCCAPVCCDVPVCCDFVPCPPPCFIPCPPPCCRPCCPPPCFFRARCCFPCFDPCCDPVMPGPAPVYTGCASCGGGVTAVAPTPAAEAPAAK